MLSLARQSKGSAWLGDARQKLCRVLHCRVRQSKSNVGLRYAQRRKGTAWLSDARQKRCRDMLCPAWHSEGKVRPVNAWICGAKARHSVAAPGIAKQRLGNALPRGVLHGWAGRRRGGAQQRSA